MKLMKIRANRTATATMNVLALSGIFAASPLLAGDTGPIPPDRERPWQNDDGSVVIGDRTFKTWQDYHNSDLFRDGRFEKCGTTLPLGDPGGDAQGFLGGGPYDCSMSRTNPTDNYDPSVVTYRIPVVVHVIRNSSGSLGNISEGQVAAGIDVLNEDMNALPGSNGEDGTDARIEFFLATEDPQGNPTNGITYSNNDTWYNDQGQYWTSLRWDTNRYLNIYTNTASGNLGYAYYPHDSAGQSWDGVRILWEVYGPDGPYGWPSNLGRVLTHEVGHYLGLLHVFESCGSSSCSTSGDLICDTESQSQPTFGCASADSCGAPDNINNYMDYSYEFCMEEFTPNQTRRMRCAIEHYRPDLPIKDDGESDEDGDGVPDAEDNCPAVENSGQADTDDDGTGDACDGCPDDPKKIEPGACGCGNPDSDTDGDGIPDCPDVIQWRIEDGGNGHWYAAMPMLKDETTMLNHTQSIGASLASISDAAEDAFVRMIAANATSDTALLGARDNGNNTFVWLDGTPFEYTNWDAGQPDGVNPYEYVAYYDMDVYDAWHDVTITDATVTHYMVEWSADCNGDSIVDYGQILDGTFDDLNGNGVPDCCDEGIYCPSCPGDFDGNGIVNGGDLGLMLGAWKSDNPAYDIDPNGVINGGDLGYLLVYWGPCP